MMSDRILMADTSRSGGKGTARTFALLDGWVGRGWLRVLDTEFAKFLWREVPDADPLVVLAAALASHQLGRGHVCLDVAATLEDPGFALSLPPEGGEEPNGIDSPDAVFAGVSLEHWLRALDCPPLVGLGRGDTPLVREGTRLYLRRYWQYEQDVRAGVDARLAASKALNEAASPKTLRRTLDALFPSSEGKREGVDWQKVACALAARSAFSVITGGPGTGKTTTVVKLLALLQSLALASPQHDGESARPLRIRLAAPTGKAAARLNESIANAVADLPLEGLTHGAAIRAEIPTSVSTLHRLLGSRPDSRQFRHHAGNLLALDVLVIDEASMIDLEMMANVLAALPATSRLILLGDKDQLASVEAGAVLGALCRRAQQGHYTAATCDWVEQATGERINASLYDEAGTELDQAVAMLRHSYRFSYDTGIGELASAINAGEPVKVASILREGFADLQVVTLAGDTEAAFRALVIDGGAQAASGQAEVASASGPTTLRRGYRHYLETLRKMQPTRDADQTAFDAWAGAVLEAHREFQVLCAPRRGPWGVEGLNQGIACLLHEAGLISATDGWYLGRPVLVTRNDYGLGLMNGDIGITLALPASGEANWATRVAFPAGDGSGIKWVLPSRLQAVETVYALTVHRSQGSEFTHAALVLPEASSPILTRELVYTGISRSRKAFTLVQQADANVLEQSVVRRVLRHSGPMLPAR